jgi:hypothetical protein
MQTKINGIMAATKEVIQNFFKGLSPKYLISLMKNLAWTSYEFLIDFIKIITLQKYSFR